MYMLYYYGFFCKPVDLELVNSNNGQTPVLCFPQVYVNIYGYSYYYSERGIMKMR